MNLIALPIRLVRIWRIRRVAAQHAGYLRGDLLAEAQVLFACLDAEQAAGLDQQFAEVEIDLLDAQFAGFDF